MPALPQGFRPLRDETPWSWKAAESLAALADSLVAHWPWAQARLRLFFRSWTRPSPGI